MEHYQGFIEAIRAKLLEHNIAYATLDAIAGWPSGYAAKVLCIPPMKRLAARTVFEAIEALGMETLLVDSAERLARVRTRLVKRGKAHPAVGKPKAVFFSNELLRINGRRGGQIRVQKLSPMERSFLASQASLARIKKSTPMQRKAWAIKANRARWKRLRPKDAPPIEATGK